MAVKITKRRFSLETAQRAAVIVEVARANLRTMSMGRALRLAKQEQARAVPVRQELEQEKP